MQICYKGRIILLFHDATLTILDNIACIWEYESPNIYTVTSYYVIGRCPWTRIYIYISIYIYIYAYEPTYLCFFIKYKQFSNLLLNMVDKTCIYSHLKLHTTSSLLQRTTHIWFTLTRWHSELWIAAMHAWFMLSNEKGNCSVRIVGDNETAPNCSMLTH